MFYIHTDLEGRRMGTYRGSDTDPKETFLHHPASLRGTAFQGGPVLRDRDADLFTQPELWSTRAPAGERTERFYYCADFRGNISALVNSAGELVEQYRYSPTGVPFGIPLGDVDADGTVDSAPGGGHSDYDIIDGLISTSDYAVRADLNLDGVVDSADLAIASAMDGQAEAFGRSGAVRV